MHWPTTQVTQIQIPVGAKIPNRSCTSAQQAVWIQLMDGNEDSFTEGFWPRDHDVNLSPLT